MILPIKPVIRDETSNEYDNRLCELLKFVSERFRRPLDGTYVASRDSKYQGEDDISANGGIPNSKRLCLQSADCDCEGEKEVQENQNGEGEMD